MGRQHVSGDNGFRLVSPHPIADTLPAVYREAWADDRTRAPEGEPFGPRFLAAFDDVLAPIVSSIDNLDAYLDPWTTPPDFLAWLGEWVAAGVDETWSEERRRAFVANAAELYRRRGTPEGLREHVAIHTGGRVEVIDNGGTAWSPVPGGKLPGTVQPLVVVSVTVEDPSSIDHAKLAALVAAAKPAHVPHRIQVGADSAEARPRGGRRAGAPGPQAGTSVGDGGGGASGTVTPPTSTATSGVAGPALVEDAPAPRGGGSAMGEDRSRTSDGGPGAGGPEGDDAGVRADRTSPGETDGAGGDGTAGEGGGPPSS